MAAHERCETPSPTVKMRKPDSTPPIALSTGSTAATATHASRPDGSPGLSYHAHVLAGSPVLSMKASPALGMKSTPKMSGALTQALRGLSSPTAASIEEPFELEPAADEVCRCCGVGQVWVSVECSQCGTDSCNCANVEWELCESCCETLLHDVCLTVQTQERSERACDAKTDVSSPGPSEVAPKSEKGEATLNAAAREFVPAEEAAMYYQQMDAYEYCSMDPYGYWDYSMCGQVEQCQEAWTVQDLKAARADMSQICIEFAAIGCCPRGDACGFIHCNVLPDKK